MQCPCTSHVYQFSIDNLIAMPIFRQRHEFLISPNLFFLLDFFFGFGYCGHRKTPWE
jgi:hypothetical protein